MKSFLELAKSEGLQNIKLVEKKSELTITFNTIQKLYCGKLFLLGYL